VGRTLVRPSALTGVRRLGLDTAPLIYLIEQHPVFRSPVLELARLLDAGEMEGVASTITLTEVLVQPLKLGRQDLVDAYRALLEGHAHLRLVSIDASIAVEAAALRGRYGLRTPDALQVAAALRSGCDAFLTNDRELTRVQELRVLLVSELVVP